MDYSWLCSSVTLQSNKQGFFNNFAESVVEKAGPVWLEKFQKLKIDKDRILACYNDAEVKDIVRGTLSNVQKIFRGKSQPLASSKFEEARLSYDKGQLTRAHLLLNQAVIRAPHDDCLLPDIYHLRSLVLYVMEDYDASLNDVQAAVKLKISEELKLDCYKRMADCYIKLGVKEKALISVKIVIKMAKLNNNKELEDKYNNILKNIDDIVKIDEKLNQDNLVLYDGESRAMQNISGVLSLKKTKEKGRHLIANAKIQSGSVLALEEPYASVLKFEKHGSHCIDCYKRLSTVIACPFCSGVAYCSTQCFNRGKNYHRWECQFFELLMGSGMSVLCLLSLRIITQSSIEQFIEILESLKSNDSDDSYLKIYNMETHANGRQAKDFLFRTLMALFLLQVLRASGYFKQHGSLGSENLTPVEVAIACFLLRHLQITQYNAHEIYETFVKPENKNWNLGDAKTHYIAVGIYLSSSMFNHACQPNLARYFIGKKLVLRAQHEIKPGEEVYENYGPSCTLKTKEERAKILMARYKFECNCIACYENWPILKEMTGIELKNSESLTLYKNIEKDFDTGVDFMNKLETDKAVELFLKYIDECSSLLVKPNKNMMLAMEALRTCWASKNNFYVL